MLPERQQRTAPADYRPERHFRSFCRPRALDLPVRPALEGKAAPGALPSREALRRHLAVVEALVGRRARGAHREDPAADGAAPGVPGLIIVANDKEVVLGCGEDPDQPQVRGVDVLELVDAQVAEPSLPAPAELRIGLERRHRADHQVVEVDEPACVQEGLKGRHGALRRRGRWPAFDLPGRDDGVERRRVWELGWRILAVRDRRTLGQRPPPRGPQQRQPVVCQPDGPSAVEEDLARHGVQGPDLDRLGAGHVRDEPAGDAGRELGGSIAVEADDPDPAGGNPAAEVAFVPGNRRNAGSIRTCAADLRRSGVLAQIPFSARYGPGSLGADVNIAGVSGTQRGALAAPCETGLQP